MTTTSSDELAHRLGLHPDTASTPQTRALAGGDPRVITVAGVGGGVGTTTVATLLGALDVGLWTHHPIAVDVLVCSPTSQSTARAEQIVGQRLAAVGCTPLIVVVSDGMRGIPQDSRSRLTTLRPLCRDVIHLPRVAAWRDTVQPVLELALGPMRRPLDAARTALDLPPLPAANPRRRRRSSHLRKDTS